MKNKNQESTAKKGKLWKKLIIAPVIAAALFLISLAVVFPKSDVFVTELGDHLPTSPTDYLFGYRFIVDKAQIDTSSVDTAKVGYYQAYASLLFYRYSIEIKVEDTTPPEITPFSDPLYIASGRDYKPEDFAEEISDISGSVKNTLKYGGSQWESISFPMPGNYSVVIESEDPSGNIGSQKIEFTVDDPPVIIGAFDRHLPVGTDFDPSSAVAVDSGDGNLTEKMTVDQGGFQPDSEGDYTVTYTVADSHGLETEKSVVISICGKDRLSAYKDESDSFALTYDELKLMCDVDFFKYKPLDTPDYERVVEMIEPTLLDLKQNRGGGSYAAGSGCIYNITPEYIYMLSVRHVMKEVAYNCDIMFFNGVIVNERLKFATSGIHNELALFRIPVSDVPMDTLLRLRQVFVDRDIYSKLFEGDDVVAFAKHWTGTDEDLIRSMKVRTITTSIKEFSLINSLLETSSGVVSGMSGTAVVDYKGNLVGLSSAIGPSTTNRHLVSCYHSKIDVLDETESALEEMDRAA